MRVPLRWLKEFTDGRGHGAEDIADLLTMAGLEVELCEARGDDTILELAVTPNRPDCLSIYGVAREVAALCKCKLRALPRRVPEGDGPIAGRVHVEVHDTIRCPRYAARLIEDVTITPSPRSVQERLEAIGLRAINNVVDATNYVMWEMGQPLHAYDFESLRGRCIHVRRLTEEQPFTTLDGIERRILPEDLMICDGEGPMAIAGVMGGSHSQVTEQTRSIVLESAYFAPTSIRRTSKRLGMTTESSRRFERGVDPNRMVLALQRVTDLICQWSGGRPSEDWYDLYPTPIEALQVDFPLTEVARLLGQPMAATEMRGTLGRLGFEIEGSGARWSVRVPTDRPDVTRTVDLVEEVARIAGYDRIPARLPSAALQTPRMPKGARLASLMRHRLAALGFYEAIHYAFHPQATAEQFRWPKATHVRLANPLGQEETVLRSSLTGGLVRAAERNFRHGATSVRFFELGRVFTQAGDAVAEEVRLAGVVGGLRHPIAWMTDQDVVNFFDIKGVVEQIADWVGLSMLQWNAEELPKFLHPGQSASVSDDAARFGYCGRLHPHLEQSLGLDQPLYAFELMFDRLASAASGCRPQYQVPVRHPGVRRDVALLVDGSIPAQAIVEAIRASQNRWIRSVELFDIYEGERLPAGKKSLAYAIQYLDVRRTLTDEEVNVAHADIVKGLVEKLGVEVRTA